MRRGITIIEILLVIAIIAILAATVVPLSSGFLIRNYAINKTNEIVTSLRIAQLNSMAGKEDSQWGVKITPADIIMFKGSTYTAGTPFDQKYSIPSSVSITQGEIVFAKNSGIPNTTASITITSAASGARTVSVNQAGTVNVN